MGSLHTQEIRICYLIDNIYKLIIIRRDLRRISLWMPYVYVIYIWAFH